MIKTTDRRTATACYIRAKKLRASHGIAQPDEIGAAAFCLEAAAQLLDRRNYWAVIGKLCAGAAVALFVAGFIHGLFGGALL